ncbi:hypothetical protein HU750_15745 [Pseudomonas sp. SWRI50]|jgi:hypothetical protein|uniref:hypothetical protein n=1 Tax=Pseudomonas sp. SWRI50 TaxID=2745484 RepID=UPI001646FB85|nr:hypothetical protein [Pseudomonas sp. SWRI50]MBC3487125.1 hypothetical protein [Pseudomonas sp. SWRI50]
MERESVALAEVNFFLMHLKQRALICYFMVASGMITLIAGIVMLFVGVTGDQVIWLESQSIKVTAGGFGAITMLTSLTWGYFAYKSRPDIKYFGPTRGMTLTREEIKRGERLRAESERDREAK